MTAPPSQLHWSNHLGPEAEAHNAQVQNAIMASLDEGRMEYVIHALKRWPPTDVLQLITALPLQQARRIFAQLPLQPSAKILAELCPDFRAELLKDETVQQLVAILNTLDDSDLGETLDEFPQSLIDEVLPRLKDSEALEARSLHGEDTAGRLMSRKFVAFQEDYTAAKAIAAIRSQYARVGRFRTVFVVDEDYRLVGRLDVTLLLTLEPNTRIGDVMDTSVLAVSAEMDQEEVLRKALRRQISSMPVIDGRGRLIGRITTDQMNQIAREEYSEDLMLMGGVSPEARSSDSVVQIIRGRLPWLMTGLLGSAVAAMVVGTFEDELQRAAILAAFIPMIMSMAGNSGLQASAVAVQGLATGAIWGSSTLGRLLREFFGALMNGVLAGAVISGLILLTSFVVAMPQPVLLALTVTSSLMVVVTVAAMVGATIPVVLDKIGVDPATATGVFITTSNDVLGVFVYFTMASLLYL